MSVNVSSCLRCHNDQRCASERSKVGGTMAEVLSITIFIYNIPLSNCILACKATLFVCLFVFTGVVL